MSFLLIFRRPADANSPPLSPTTSPVFWIATPWFPLSIPLCESAELAPGDRVQTLRGSSAGTVVRISDDGRVVWKPDASTLEFTGLPESLKRE